MNDTQPTDAVFDPMLRTVPGDDCGHVHLIGDGGSRLTACGWCDVSVEPVVKGYVLDCPDCRSVAEHLRSRAVGRVLREQDACVPKGFR